MLQYEIRRSSRLVKKHYVTSRGKKGRRKKSPFTKSPDSFHRNLRDCPHKLRFAKRTAVRVSRYICLQGQGHGATIFRLVVCDADRMEGATKIRVGAPSGFTMGATTLNLFTHLPGRTPRVLIQFSATTTMLFNIYAIKPVSNIELTHASSISRDLQFL